MNQNHINARFTMVHISSDSLEAHTECQVYNWRRALNASNDVAITALVLNAMLMRDKLGEPGLQATHSEEAKTGDRPQTTKITKTLFTFGIPLRLNFKA
tara:strand:- start:36312 stop:36608 length:297 start_codon:yes stop_codon:yes gene_type:complete